MLSSGKFIPKWKHEEKLNHTVDGHRDEAYNDGFKAGQEKMVEELEVKVIVNGHRYNII